MVRPVGRWGFRLGVIAGALGWLRRFWERAVAPSHQLIKRQEPAPEVTETAQRMASRAEGERGVRQAQGHMGVAPP
jgi:hypothetical protein